MKKGDTIRTKITIPVDGFDRKREIPAGSCGRVIAVNPQGMPLVKFAGHAWPQAFAIEDVELVS